MALKNTEKIRDRIEDSVKKMIEDLNPRVKAKELLLNLGYTPIKSFRKLKYKSWCGGDCLFQIFKREDEKGYIEFVFLDTNAVSAHGFCLSGIENRYNSMEKEQRDLNLELERYNHQLGFDDRLGWINLSGGYVSLDRTKEKDFLYVTKKTWCDDSSGSLKDLIYEKGKGGVCSAGFFKKKKFDFNRVSFFRKLDGLKTILNHPNQPQTAKAPDS